MRLLTVLLFGVFLVATQVFLVLKAMQDNLFERDVDPVDAVMERQASISDELTPQERLWLSKNHTVRVGVDPDFYPLEKFDAEGRYTGIGPDYLRILHKMTGLSFRIAPPSDWTNTIDMATSHKVDMYIAAAETQHRSQYMLFTPSYIVLPGIIVTRQPTKGESVTRGAATDETEPSIDGLKDLAGKRVAVVNRYSWHDFLEELHPEITPVPVKNTLEGLQKVAFGEVDAMIDYQFNITEKINNSGIRNLRAAGSIDAPYGHAFGIRKDWPELHSIINKALSKITPEERRIIAQKWLQPYEKKAFSKQTIWMMLFAAEVLFTVFAFVLYWNFSLKRQVSRRTAQLNQELAKYDRAEKELRESRAMLEQSNVELEHRVNERTRDLQASTPSSSSPRKPPTPPPRRKASSSPTSATKYARPCTASWRSPSSPCSRKRPRRTATSGPSSSLRGRFLKSSTTCSTCRKSKPGTLSLSRPRSCWTTWCTTSAPWPCTTPTRAASSSS